MLVKRRRRRRKIKRRVVSTRRRRKDLKFEVKSHIVKEIWGVVYLALATLTYLSIKGQLGVFGDYWHRTLQPVFGWGTLLIPAVFFGVAIGLFLMKDIRFGLARVTGVLLFLIAILGTVHLSVPFDEALVKAQAGEFGGYVGFVSSFVFSFVLGNTGSYVVFFALFLIAILLMFEVSLVDIISWINSIQFFKKRVARKKEAAQDEELNIVKPEVKKEEPMMVLREVPKDSEDTFEEDLGEDTALTSDSKYEWEAPPLDLLESGSMKIHSNDALLRKNAEKIKEKLRQFGIEVSMQDVHVGPTVMQYTLQPHAGIKLSKITGLKSDLALALAAKSIRIEAPIPGKSLVGIEIPNSVRTDVRLKDLMETPEYSVAKSKLKLILGRDVSGKPIFVDLAKMPHLLIAGATGTGKSVCLNNFLISLIYQNSPEELKFIMIDPKRVELANYNSIPYLLSPVINDPEKAAIALRWAVAEVNKRYRLCVDAGHRSIDEYNADHKIDEKMPKIVIVVDELADMMMAASREVEASICRLAQMARAVGIHLVIATQRPSVDVITGLIKANIPARVAFTVASSIDSRTILDSIGAEDLLGDGDMLYLPQDDSRMRRIQGVFMSSKEIEKVTNWLKLKMEPVYHDEVTSQEVVSQKIQGIPGSRLQGQVSSSGSDDSLYDEALRLVIDTGKASASLLQRRLKVGYARAARLLDEMEDNKVVGPSRGAKPREIIGKRE